MPQLQFRPTDVNRDVAAWELPPHVLSDAQNIIFTEGFAQSVNDPSDFIDTVDDTDFLLNNALELSNHWLCGHAAGVNVTDGAAVKDITPTVFAAPVANGQWTGGTLNSIPFLNWRQGSAWWDNDFGTPGLMTLLTDAPTLAPLCRAMRSYKFFLIALNTNDHSGANNIPAAEEVVAWSDAGEPGTIPTFVPAADNQAGSIVVGAQDGPVIDGAQLRDDFYILKSSSISILSFIGGTRVMGLRPLLTSTGVLTNNCVAEVDGALVIITDSDIIAVDGQGVRSVIDNRNRKYFFGQLGNEFDTSYLTYYPVRRELWACVPTGSEAFPTRAMVWDIDRDVWGWRNLNVARHAANGVVDPDAQNEVWDDFNTLPADSWDAQTRIWNAATTKTALRGLLWADDNLLKKADGGAVQSHAYLTRNFLPWGDPLKVKTSTAFYPHVFGTTGDVLKMRIGAAMSADGPVRWGASQDFVIGRDLRVPQQVTGRYLSVWVEGLGQRRWEYSGCDVDYEDRGMF